MAVLIGVETVLLVLLSVLVAGLLRSHAEILRALHRLGVDLDGTEAMPRRTTDGAAAGQAYDLAGVTPAPAGRVTMVALAASVAWVAYLAMVPLPRLLAAVGESGR